MNPFLEATEIIDWQHPDVLAHAMALAEGAADEHALAKRCFEWVRDEIQHSRDYGLQPVTCSASEVLSVGSGYCFAKSHLLAALLRANGLPAALSYQRLSRDDHGAPYCLHGLNAVFLPVVGWYRLDPRGNRADIDARFIPPEERLAFTPSLAGEVDFPEILPAPLPVIVQTLRTHRTADAVWAHLPDVEAPTLVDLTGR